MRLLYCDVTLAHVMGLSLYRCFLSARTFHWLILKIDLELSTVEGTGLYSPSEFPSMSCKFQEDGVALADTILLNGLWKLTADQPGPDFFRVSSDALSSRAVTEILHSNTEANHHNAFEC